MNLSYCFRYHTPFLIVVCFLLLKGTEGKPQRLSGRRQKRDTSVVNSFFEEFIQNGKVDIVFLMDRSKAIGADHFIMYQKKIAMTIVRNVLYVSGERAKVGIITFGTDVTVVYNGLNTTNEMKCSLVEDMIHWNKVQFPSGQEQGTNYVDAFRTALEMFQQGSRLRTHTRKLLVLFSDGEFKTEGEKTAAVNEAEKLQFGGQDVIIYGVGVGQWFDRTHNSMGALSSPGKFSDVDTWLNVMKSVYSLRDRPIQAYMKGLTFKGVDGQDSACAFPFIYENDLYYECINVGNNGIPWCSVDHIYQRRWGNCLADGTPDLQPYQGSTCSCGPHASCFCDAQLGYTTCLCNPGYTLENGTCKACPIGYYKEKHGNGHCDICPSISSPYVEAATDLDHCICNGACTDHCNRRNCGEHRQCIPLGDSTIEAYTCHYCMEGYTGEDCELDTNECSSNPCMNGGTCLDGIDTFACICEWGYTGRNCESEIDECQESMCSAANTEQCMDSLNKYECRCRPGWYGIHCEDRDSSGSNAYPDNEFPQNDVPDDNTPGDTKPDNKTEQNDKPKAVVSEDGGMTETERLLMIIAIPAGLALIILIISAAALIHVIRENNRRKRNNSCATDTTSVISKNASLISFGSKCYKDEGTPMAPTTGFDIDLDSAVYGNEPLQRGMDEWYAYMLGLIHGGVMTKVAIVRLDGDKWVLSPGLKLDKNEIETIYSVITSKRDKVKISFQGRQYGVVNNEDYLITAHSTDNGDVQEILCSTKTRQFVIVCTATFSNDGGRCKKEIQKLRKHIKEQGL